MSLSSTVNTVHSYSVQTPVLYCRTANSPVSPNLCSCMGSLCCRCRTVLVCFLNYKRFPMSWLTCWCACVKSALGKKTNHQTTNKTTLFFFLIPNSKSQAKFLLVSMQKSCGVVRETGQEGLLCNRLAVPYLDVQNNEHSAFIYHCIPVAKYLMDFIDTALMPVASC